MSFVLFQSWFKFILVCGLWVRGWWGGVRFCCFFGAFLKVAFLGVWFYGHHHIVELFGAFGFEWWCTREADRSGAFILSLSLSLSLCAENQPAAI